MVSSTVFDFLCGFISGVSQVFVQQPFEIIKVRLINQSLYSPEYTSIADCFRKIVKNDGLLGLYKGKRVLR